MVDSLLDRTVRFRWLLEKTRKRHRLTTGTVKRVVSERGFALIGADDGIECSVQRGSLQPSRDFDRLAGGESVTLGVESSPKGLRAVQVGAG